MVGNRRLCAFTTVTIAQVSTYLAGGIDQGVSWLRSGAGRFARVAQCAVGWNGVNPLFMIKAVLIKHFGAARAPVRWLTCVMLSATTLSAQSPMTADAEISYHVVRQSLGQMLTEIARDTGVSIDVSDDVRAMIENTSLTGSLEQVLDQLALRYELEYFYFNGVYYISSRSETHVRLYRLGNLSQDLAFEALEESGLNFARFPATLVASGTAIALTGPRKLLGLREAVLDSVTAPESVVVGPKTIVVRRALRVDAEVIGSDAIASRVLSGARLGPQEPAPVEDSNE